MVIDMNLEIKKYSIVLIGSILLANVIGFLVAFFPAIFSSNSYIYRYAMPFGVALILLIVTVIVWRDMLSRNEKVDYLLLLLTLFNQYAGVILFLFWRFFNRHSTSNDALT